MSRSAPLAVLAAVLIVLVAGPAAAHVTVDPGEVARGGFAELTFRVPNERDDASTTRVEVVFPTDTPVASASVRPLSGWTVAVRRAKLAQPVQTDDGELTEGVSRIIWSGGRIAPGQYENFSISAGPLPEHADRVVFKALQTYSDGEVVRWIEEATPGAAEPEHPAPVLRLTAPAGDQSGTVADPTTGGGQAVAAPAASKAEVDDARRLGILGLSAGIIGLLVAVIALIAAARRRPGPAGAD